MTKSKSKKKGTDDQYDSPWKEAIEEYFQECMTFFFPEIHDDINWSKGYQFLDKELGRVVREAVVTKHYVDKLVRVYRQSGEETWVLVHIDVQSQHDTDFAERMYIYNYRLFDMYHLPVVTLAIYGDKSKKWRPKEYKRDLWGFELRMKFPSVKLMDYNISELEQNNNPFAIVVLAHLHTKATKHQHETRYDLKWRLTRMLYERGYNQKQVESLYRYINWMMALPPFLERKLDNEIVKLEEVRKVAYITSIERRGIQQGFQEGTQQGIQEGIQKGIQQGFQEGIQEGIQKILNARFGEIPESLVGIINKIDNQVKLESLLIKAATIESLKRFKQFLTDMTASDTVDDSPKSED